MENIITLQKTLDYVLITPARNEGKYIGKTIESVLSQTVLPKKWVIVSDGSTDNTDDIVSRHTKNVPWVTFIRIPEKNDRSFAAKVTCFNEGFKELKNVTFDIVGNLDADISFGREYFDFLISKFREMPSLGVAGTPFVEGNSVYNYNFTNIEHVSGACQLFRKKCFEDIGGYKPIKGGGIDWVAVTSARMKGWKTRTFTENICYHNKNIGAGQSSALATRFKYGKKDYYLGSHPLWEFFRSLYQMKYSPYILGGLFLFLGYFWAYISRMNIMIPEELVVFRRKEEMERLKRIMLRNV